MPTTQFRASTRCTAGGCAEWSRLADGGIVIRSSKRPTEAITLDAVELADFLTAIHAGELDQ